MSDTTLAPAIVRTPSWVREGVFVVAGVLLISLAAQVVIVLPFTPVPITGQTFAFLLVGAGYGATRGTITAAAYIAIGLFGAPVFASATSGTATLFSATGGYLVGMLIAAALVGFAAERGWDRRLVTSVLAMLAGSVVIYLVGATWLAVSAHLGVAEALHLGVTPFVVGDLAKIALAGALLPSSWAVLRWTRS